MAKGTRGGKRITASIRAAAPKVVPTQVSPPTPQQVAQGNVLPKGGVAYSDFQNMSDDEKADVITAALGVGTPLFLDDSGMQKFAYYTGMSDKPVTVSDSQLDGIKGTELFRTVSDAYNPSTDIGYTANDIVKQIRDGDFTMYSDSGGSVHGKAIYFANNYGDSAAYGGKNAVTMRAKITNGNVISETKADTQYRNALARGDKLALACSNADRSSARNLYTLATGHNVISSGTYYMVLNRGALTVSDKTKKTVYGGRW